MARPFSVIHYRKYRPDTQSAISGMRIETEADASKAKKMKRLIKKARKLGMAEDTIEALYSEFKPYFYLHMTRAEMWHLEEKFRDVGLSNSWPSMSGYGMNFQGSAEYVITDVEDPAAAFQSALESLKETVLFSGVVEIEYRDNSEIKFLNVRKSVVTTVDEYPR